MLLTSSQVSMAISSTIVIVFTSLLFISGYVLQQRTVAQLQTIIKPRMPVPSPHEVTISFDPRAKAHRRVGSDDDAPSISYQKVVQQAETDWTRLAYVQLVKSHFELCSAIMLFAELHKQRSPARRVLMFPKTWAVGMENGKKSSEVMDPYLSLSRRLLRIAARRYGVMLEPMEPVAKDLDDEKPESYSLASMFGLQSYDRVIHLQPPGMLLDAAPLDAILAFAEQEHEVAVPETESTAPFAAGIMSLRPSSETYKQLASSRKKKFIADEDLFQRSFKEVDALRPPSSNEALAWVSDTYAARTDPAFNATRTLHSTVYIRVWDPDVPGPEYDMPYDQRIRLRPADEQAKRFWDSMYFKFADDRQDICGLDLEAWTPVEEETVREDL